MFHMVSLEPVDYLVIGHITVDLSPSGPVLGGSAAYAALTARALGLRVGVVTVRGNELPLTELDGIPVVSGESDHSTTFENVYTPAGRVQYIRHTAAKIDLAIVPEIWRKAKIIHLAPVAQEVNWLLPPDFHPTLLALTPQGWMRSWDGDGRVYPCAWQRPEEALRQVGALVFSVEDVARDEEAIDLIANASRILAVTEGADGVRLFWNGDSRRFRPPMVTENDPTGAGDIFAAAFFVRLLNTRDPWEAARFANRLASISVTRRGMAGVPSVDEVRTCLVEVM
ncbi:MAG: PfkB family carbohydrate kinase [Chloroflexi bacterium]|nr:PfkB family carbohydrate kinase [Chloroflexota bacterium]